MYSCFLWTVVGEYYFMTWSRCSALLDEAAKVSDVPFFLRFYEPRPISFFYDHEMAGHNCWRHPGCSSSYTTSVMLPIESHRNSHRFEWLACNINWNFSGFRQQLMTSMKVTGDGSSCKCAMCTRCCKFSSSSFITN